MRAGPGTGWEAPFATRSVRHTLRAHGFAFLLGNRFLERPLNRRQTAHRIAPPQRQIAFAVVV